MKYLHRDKIRFSRKFPPKPELYLDWEDEENLLNRVKVSKLKTVPVLDYQSSPSKNVNGSLTTFSPHMIKMIIKNLIDAWKDLCWHCYIEFKFTDYDGLRRGCQTFRASLWRNKFRSATCQFSHKTWRRMSFNFIERQRWHRQCSRFPYFYTYVYIEFCVGPVEWHMQLFCRLFAL